MARLLATILLLCASNIVSAQTFTRLGGCPSLGCIFPPDQADFLPGQYFDVRLEVHAPVNGTEAYNGGVPDEGFSLCIQNGAKGKCVEVSKFFNVPNALVETWSFSYYEDLFAKDAGQITAVNVASKAYRALQLTKPGTYYAKLNYYSGLQTVATWRVREAAKKRAVKNVLLFIGDGMTQPMITAARLIAHKSINGVYQSLMQMDTMDALGHQMTHSMDSFITDSANSATALYSGKKSSVNALNVWADSSPNSLDDPKMETFFEIFRRTYGGALGMVSTAVIADATPAAMCSHTRDRDQFASVIFEYLYGANKLNATLPWPTGCDGPDVIFGGGAELFIAGTGSPNGTDFYNVFQSEGYDVLHDNTSLQRAGNDKKTLGIFTKSNMAKWLDREVYTDNLRNQANSPTGDGTDATDQPGLKEMTLKAIDILQQRQKKGTKGHKGGNGWVMMSEGASIDKMMHALDYDRALGELLELDDTIRASIQHLKKLGILDETLIVVTADHGHGFDVFGGADTKYLSSQTSDRKKRNAIGTYQNSGLSGYTVAEGSLPTNNTVIFGAEGPNFPVTWSPRYTYAGGFAANPDHREGYTVKTTGPRSPTTAAASGDYMVNPADQQSGFVVNGTIATSNSQGVHSLTDVSVFAHGPCSSSFRGVYNSIDIFFKIADCLALGKQ